MNIPPVSRSVSLVNAIMQSRDQMLDLSRQLGTGRKSETYGGLGSDRIVSIGVRGRITAIQGYQRSNDVVSTRLKIVNQGLERMHKITQDARSSTLNPAFDLNGGNKSSVQALMKNYLDEFVSHLNLDVAGRYMFGGRISDKPPVVSVEKIMDGDGARDGFRTIVNQRRQADLGADGRGRFGSSVAADTVSFAEDGVHPFGFKLKAINTIGGATAVTAPAGSPATGSVQFTAVPAVGAEVSVTLTLPDGTDKAIKLKATDQSPVKPGEFLIGADANATAANFQSAFDTALLKAGDIELKAASTIKAADDFFKIDDANPPQRVDGPPFDTATAMVAGTTANTVFWYEGDGASDNPRQTTSARIDTNISVNYGLRANETPFRNAIAKLAAFSVAEYAAADPNARERYMDLAGRVTHAFSEQSGVENVRNVSAQLAAVNAEVVSTQERLTIDKGVAEQVVGSIEAADVQEVGVKLLQMQTRLQATYQTTSIVAKLSIMDYL